MASHFPSSRPASHLAIHTHAALPFILEHVLTYPERYHIGTGRKENRKSKESTLKENRTSLSSPPPSTASTLTSIIAGVDEPSDVVDSADFLRQAGDTFKEVLMQRIAMSPIQPFRLPPTYIMDFVRNVFTEDLCLVDFTQALTGMDYLRDLENRRKREMDAAFERLGVEPSMLDREKLATLKSERPEVGTWVNSILDKAKRIDSLYTQVYIGLRRWTLINEMRLEPFNKANCIAMLNTLYPPSYPTPPTSQLTPMLLNTQRNAFFRYVLAVESNGKSVLQKLEQQGKRPTDANAWPIVRIIVDKYLRTASHLVQECTHVNTEEDIASASAVLDKRTDSGVSFAGNNANAKHDAHLSERDVHPAHRRPSTTQDNYPDMPRHRDGSVSKPSGHHRHTSSDESIQIVRPDTLRHKEVRKVGSTLERLARELKRMRSRSNDGRAVLDDATYADRPRSRSRGPSDASQSSGSTNSNNTGIEFGDPFTIAAAPTPPPPVTASTVNFPDFIRDEDDHVMPLPPLTRPRGLKKMKSAGSLSAIGMATRESAISGLKQGLSMERKGSGQGQETSPGYVQVHNVHYNPMERKFSVPTPTSVTAPGMGSSFIISEEQRRNLIARARVEKENLGQHPAERRHSPIESRVDALLNGSYGASSNLSAINLDLMSDVPVRRNSPGRNKLRDFYGMPNFEVPTSFAH